MICERGKAVPGAICFEVPETVAAFRQLGAAWRREFSIPLVLVAGAVGKTTTKEILSAILQGKWKSVLKTQGSQNGFVGIPMTLLELKESHDAAVIEVGIDEIGAMEQHLPLVEATVAVLTAIGPEHLEKLKDIPTVAREEGFALQYVADQGGLIAVNLDDEWIKPHAALPRGSKIRYSLSGAPDADLRGELSASLDAIAVTGRGFQGARFELPMPGRHNAQNALAAIAIAVGLGLTEQEIRAGLAGFKAPEGRSQVRALADGTPVLCDYYNANPTSTEAALELLTQMASSGKRRWACLADMLELGPDELSFHRGLASKIRSLGVERVLLFGPRMKSLAQELGGTAEHFETHAALASRLASELRSGDVVLIKGSRGMKMEEVWKLLESRK